MTTATKMHYQLKATLNGIRPPIWRRILVPHDITLAALHEVLQIAFGWTDSHLHEFTAGDTLYGQSDPDCGTVRKDEHRARLHRVLTAPGARMTYTYDFGDDWEHTIVLEKVLTPDPQDAGTAFCSAGARACPPEDCGGPWGYEELLAALRDPKHPEHQQMREWLVEDFDPESFDAQEVNELLAELQLRPPAPTGRRRNRAGSA
ncbi:MAG TPA: plasmid pRiA4b ORF-3 family protein [Xanthomonadaceae bacterium]|nr:plasmid pRiA4b ORF-3 family protein [Xanthomonadaceae bacterium]